MVFRHYTDGLSQTAPRGDYARIMALLRAAEKTDAADPHGLRPGRVKLIRASEWEGMTAEQRLQQTKTPSVIKADRNIYSPGKLCSNGNPLTAQDFVDGVNDPSRVDRLCSEVLYDDLGRVPCVKVQIQGQSLVLVPNGSPDRFTDTCRRPYQADGHENRQPRQGVFERSEADFDNMIFCGTLDAMESFRSGVLNCLDMPLRKPPEPGFM
jgi:hypothetical protein